MLQNAYFDAKIGVDPAENEPPKECCVVAGRTRIASPTRSLLRARPLAGRGCGLVEEALPPLGHLDFHCKKTPQRMLASRLADPAGTQQADSVPGKSYNFYKNFVKISPNFSKIFTNFCIQYSIFQHFSKSTHFCKILQKILQNFA